MAGLFFVEYVKNDAGGSLAGRLSVAMRCQTVRKPASMASRSGVAAIRRSIQRASAPGRIASLRYSGTTG